MNRRTKLMIAKYALYVLLMVILYVLQTDPNLFAIAGVKPVLVLPFAVCIAMFDSQLAGGLFGLLAGILCDTSSNVLFGFQSILYLLICTAVGLLHAAFGDQQSDLCRLRFCGQAAAGIFFLLRDVGVRQRISDSAAADAAKPSVHPGPDAALVSAGEAAAPFLPGKTGVRETGTNRMWER